MKTILAILALVFLFIAWLAFASYRPSAEAYQRKLEKLSAKIEKDPMNAELYRKRGEIYLARSVPAGIERYLPVNAAEHQQDLLLAEQDFEKAFSLNPSSRKYELLLANTKVGRLMPELKSLRVFSDIGELTGEKDFLRGQPREDKNWNALFLEEKDKLQEVLRWLNVVLKYKKECHLYRLYRGEVAFALQDKTAAYQDLSDAIDATSKERFDPETGKIGYYYPKVVEYLYTRAACYLLDHDNEKALEDMNQAAKIWPYYADVYTKRAFFYRYIGDKEKALADLEEAKRQRPNRSKDYEEMAAAFKKS